MKSSTVLLGFSGGIRSAVAAVLLRTQGIDVEGVFLDFSGTAWSTRCRADSWETANARASVLGIPLIRVPVAPIFEALVSDSYLHDVLSRRVPQTCLNCHSQVLLPALAHIARERSRNRLASGHRACLIDGSVIYRDQPGDQSTWLAFLPREILKQLFLPLGDFSDQQLSRLAGELPAGFEPVDSGATRRSCELKTQEALKWAASRLPTGTDGPGDMMLGGVPIPVRVEGIFEHPIGSSVSADSRLGPVVAVDYELGSRTLKIEAPHQTQKQELFLRELLWIDEPPEKPAAFVDVDMLPAGLFQDSRPQKPVAARVFLHLERAARMTLEAPMERLLPGTPLVFLRDARIIGSAWVDS